jgi:hypothetical protein
LPGIGGVEGGGAAEVDQFAEDIAGGTLDLPVGFLAADVVNVTHTGLSGTSSAYVESLLRMVAEGIAEAEVADGIGIDDHAGHECGGEHDANNDCGKQPPIARTSLGNDPDDRRETHDEPSPEWTKPISAVWLRQKTNCSRKGTALAASPDRLLICRLSEQGRLIG